MGNFLCNFGDFYLAKNTDPTSGESSKIYFLTYLCLDLKLNKITVASIDYCASCDKDLNLPKSLDLEVEADLFSLNVDLSQENKEVDFKISLKHGSKTLVEADANISFADENMTRQKSAEGNVI